MLSRETAAPLSWGNVALAASMLAINVVISGALRLKLEWQIIIAGARCFVQLTVLGLVLEQVFSTESAVVVFGMTGILGGLAALEVSEWKAKRTVKGMFWITFVSIFGSAITVGLIGAAFAMNFDPPFIAAKFIPVMGMLFGNTIVGVTLGMESVLAAVDQRRDAIETMLCFGASRWESLRPIAVEAARTAMVPSITAMSITGLISIPGMMSGQILGGADVMDAARYQQVIVFMISASVALGVVISVTSAAFIVVDSQPQLRPERIINKANRAASKSASGSHGSTPDDPEAPDEPLSWGNVGIAALLLGINIVLSLWFRLGLSTSLLVSAARCVVQLTALGLVLKEIFLTENPIYIFGMTLVLGMLAAFEVTYWRSKYQFPWMYTSTLVSITGSALLVALFGNAYALNMSPAYTAVKFIPTIGMLFGKCMIGVSIGMGSVMDSLDSHRDRIETSLCFGSTRWEATKPLVVEALRNALLPTITNMSITGLISIPGMMTGWILGGADVLEAARYQQIILFMISASTATSTLLSVLFCTFVLVDRSPRLRLDRLSSTSKLEVSSGKSSNGNSRPMSRMERLRSNCRPVSDMNLSGRRSPRSARISISGPLPPNKQDGSKGLESQQAKHKQTSLKPSKSTSLLRPVSPNQTHLPADIEDAAEQCRKQCGISDRVWRPAKDGVPAPEYNCLGDGAWKGNWCACCPLRSKLQSSQQGAGAMECYGFQEDPGDIVIPHPPALLSIMPGSSSKEPSREPRMPKGKTKPYPKSKRNQPK
ncbi:hypothetical protein EV183_000762 [Coemansia sp. RSA 2336]|nr:hypothetical protein EV183_000762 [Coemansia sp. RSA 2336]